MKNLLIIASFLFTLSSYANELSIGNSYRVDQDGFVYRGREPKSLVSELATLGVSDVIIFKNEVKSEVQEEIASLNKLGIRSHHIPFHWRQFPSYQAACEQVIDALAIIHRVKKVQGRVYFHCTAGEDRTGMLAGLYRMLDEGLSRDQVFKVEMCERLYSDGNPNKPKIVVAAIQKDLTPLFIALAEKIESGEWNKLNLSKKSCKDLKLVPTKLNCKNRP